MKMFLKAATVLTLFAVVLFVIFQREDKRNDEITISQNEGLELSDGKDELARLNWEKQRLQNPETGEIPDNIAIKQAAFARNLPAQSNLSFSNRQKKAGDWKQRGPHNIGGRTRAMAIDVNDPNTLVIGGVSGGVYRSEDAGSTWTRATTTSQLQSVTDIIQDTREGHTNEWYFCSGEIYGNSADYPGDGIFKSIDGGRNWIGLQIEGRPQEFRHLNYGWRLVLDHTRNDSTILYLASWGAILRSADGGKNWKQVLGGRTSRIYRTGADIAISESGVLYATMSSNSPNNAGGYWRSEDGLNWTNIMPKDFTRTVGRTVVDIFDANENVVYFLAHTPSAGKYGESNSTQERNSLWRYEYLQGDGADSNGTWLDLSENIPDYRQSEGYIWGDFIAQGGYNLVVRVHPRSEDSIIIGATNLYASTDGFRSQENTEWIGGYRKTKDRVDGFFNGLVYPNHHPDQHQLFFHPNDFNKAFSAHDGGINVTSDCWSKEGVEWTNLNNGFYSTQFYTIALNQNPNEEHALSDIMLGGFQDNETQYLEITGETDDNWKRMACCDGSYAGVFDTEEHTYVVASKQLGTMYMRKFDAAGNDVGSARIDPEGGVNYFFINPYVHNPNQPQKIYLAGGNFLWRNRNVTTIPLKEKNEKATWNWERMMDARTDFGNRISALDCSTKPANVLYFGTEGGEVYRVDSVEDEEYIVNDLTDGRPIGGDGYISGVSVDPENSDVVLICYSNYERKSIYFSEDGGQNWRDVSGNLEEFEDGSGSGPACNTVRIIRDQAGMPIYLVGTSVGLYSTTGLPGTNTVWNKEGQESIGNCSVRDIDYRRSDGLLLIGTHGCGSYSAYVDVVASVKEVKEPLSVYPNPFKESINISGNQISFGSYKVYDLKGRLIKKGVLNSEHLNLSDLKNGSYVLMVENDKEVFTKTIIKE